MNLLYIHIYPFFFRFFSHIGHYRILRRVPCAIQQVLVGYLFYRLESHAQNILFRKLKVPPKLFYNSPNEIGGDK